MTHGTWSSAVAERPRDASYVIKYFLNHSTRSLEVIRNYEYLMSRHYSTLNISETVQDATWHRYNGWTYTYTRPNQGFHKTVSGQGWPLSLPRNRRNSMLGYLASATGAMTSKVKDQGHTGLINGDTQRPLYLPYGKAYTNFNIGIPMEDDDPHQPLAPWPPSSKDKVAMSRD